MSKTTTANYLYKAKVDKNYVHSGKMGKYAKARDKGIKRAEKNLGKKVSDRVNYTADYDTRSMRQDPNKSDYPRKIKVKEDVTIQDAKGRDFLEIIDIVKPQPMKSPKNTVQWTEEKIAKLMKKANEKKRKNALQINKIVGTQ